MKTMLKVTLANNIDMKELFTLRKKVFVIEQQVDEQLERDDLDGIATHVIARVDGTAVGCCRFFVEENSIHIGRLAVLKHYRHQGIGTAICNFVAHYGTQLGKQYLWLNAQLVSKDFYTTIGFTEVGEIFTEASMQHVKMIKFLE